MADAANVNAARGDIGGDKNFRLTRFKRI